MAIGVDADPSDEERRNGAFGTAAARHLILVRGRRNTSRAQTSGPDAGPPGSGPTARTDSSAPYAAGDEAGPAAIDDIDVALIRDSFACVTASAYEMTEYFFARLFAEHPEVRSLFPLTLGETRAAVLEAAAQAVWLLDKPHERDEYLRQAGRDNRKAGLREQHYQFFFDSLLATLRHASAARWTAAHEATWEAALAHAGQVMRDGAEHDAAERPAWYVAEVVQHDQRTPTIAVLTVRPDRPLAYVPGQHVSVQVQRWPRIWRSYSIANAPRESGLLDFHVRAIPGGMVSNALVGSCGPGDTVILGPPLGSLRPPADPDRNLVCVAGGTGLAPVKAIIESVVSDPRPGRRRTIVLYLAVRRQSDLYDMRDLWTLQAAYPALSVIPVVGSGGEDEPAAARPGNRQSAVTRPLRLPASPPALTAAAGQGDAPAEEAGAGEAGSVAAWYRGDFAGSPPASPAGPVAATLPAVLALHPSFRDTEVYVAGPEGMIRETLHVLADRVPLASFHHDSLDALRRTLHRPSLAETPR